MLNTGIYRHGQRGFTLVELMIAVAVVGILLTQAVPSFSAWIQNAQIRNSAEAILNGLQLARAQAVQRNTSVEFALVAAGTDPVAANVGATASVSGTNWIVRNYVQPPGANIAADFIQGRSGQEGSKNATVAAGQGSFVFTSLGRLLNPPAANVNIDVGSGNTYTNKRTMRVIVSPGGQILMCDPNKVDPSNPQFCP
ncbi:MAG: GspH/FimT family pseudopilin [Betaproteobacteria bacterium]|nr:GspH/FimT family pseudopilin [Betaproteobacteria bacterium]